MKSIEFSISTVHFPRGSHLIKSLFSKVFCVVPNEKPGSILDCDEIINESQKFTDGKGEK